jgi:hypothetical protein
MTLPLDHLVVAVPDVAAAQRAVADALGVSPEIGGSHPDIGTCNALLSLGGDQYLELIGPDPKAVTPGELARRVASLESAEIWGFAVASQDLDSLAERARGLGLRTVGPTVGSRRTPAGELLRWRALGLSSLEFGGLVPFAIDWLDTPHPARTSPQGPHLEAWHVAHPRPDDLRALYAELGVALNVHAGLRSAIVATIVHGDRRLTLTGPAPGLF